MVSTQVNLGLIAIFLGIAIGVVLFVPFVLLSYRRRGEFSFARWVLWSAALIYFWAIWTYTLLPLPDPGDIQCVGMITDPMSVVNDLREAVRSPGRTITHPAFLQLALNVILFVPLGFFLRVLVGRGILASFFIGLGVSLFVETTQLTGIWGLYPCAYRFFDVGDLMTNTAGAVIGSIAALVIPPSHRGLGKPTDADSPRPVTRGRRLLAMLCDWLAFTLISGGIIIAAQLYLRFVAHDEEAFQEGVVAAAVGIGGAALFWLLLILFSGMSVGDYSVQLRYDGSPLPTVLARLLRWAGGIAGLSALGIPEGALNLLSIALFVLACLLPFFTKAGRGLPGLISGQYLRDARQ